MAISTESSGGVALALSGAGTKRPPESRESVRATAALASFRFSSSASASATTTFDSMLAIALCFAWCFSALALRRCDLFGDGKN